MIAVTILALANIVWRLNGYNTEAVTPIGIVILSVAIAVLVSVGSTFGGTLVYEYGFDARWRRLSGCDLSRPPRLRGNVMSGPVTAADATARVESPVVGSAVLEVTESRVSEVGEFEVRRALPQHSGRMVGA